MTTNDIHSILRSEDRFIIVTHVNPDGDAVGSLLAMHLALREMGKKTWPVSSEKIPDLYCFLPGLDDILTDTDQLATIKPDWIISLDVATEDRISGNISRFRETTQLINIDHHATNPHYGQLNLIDHSATSTAELVFQVLTKAGYQLSVDVGKCLYTGLVTDTGCFRFSGVNTQTMNLAARLLEPGFDSYEITRLLYEEYPLSRLELERLLLSRIEIFLNGSIVVSTLNYEDFQRVGAPLSDGENLVDRLRESRGVEAGILMTQISDEIVRVSFRSKGLVDVSAIAASFGGGGHPRAAGLRSNLPLDELKEKILRTIEKTISES